MDEEKKSIIVPWDFTPLCDAAFQHALNFNKALASDIVLVHIVSSSSKVAEATKRLEGVAIELEKKFHYKPLVFAKEGKVESTLTDLSKDLSATLYVMKTDGIKGMEKYFGSRAMKVIFQIPVPTIVVQAPPTKTEYKSIVFPIDYSFESKEKLHWIKWMSKLYKTQIQIITPDIADSGLRQKIKNNVIFAKNILNDENINFEIIVGAGKGEFGQACIDFAYKADADIIMVMMPKDIGLRECMSGAKAQRIVANSRKVPVFVINPRKLRKMGGFS